MNVDIWEIKGIVRPRVPEGIVGLVARLTAGAKLVPALIARGPTLGHRVRYRSAEAPH
jgi:hypothetical protein